MGGEMEKWDHDFEDYSYEYDPPSQGYALGAYADNAPSQGYAVGAYADNAPSQGYAVGAYADNQVGSYERSWRSHDRDRATGSYQSASTKEVVSHGETFKERSTGRVGYKDEHKSTTTFRVGDRSGYTEYQYQERARHVDFSGGSSSRGKSSVSKGNSGGYSSKKYLN